jgi:uncharacterized protein YbaP (TraB family)
MTKQASFKSGKLFILFIARLSLNWHNMKKLVLWAFVCAAGITASAQQTTSNNSLLWRISGKNLSKPSYLFGTIHLLCADDVEVSPNLKMAISETDKVYLELDMDNLFEMMQAVQKMKMRNDTTLSDLLSKTDYEKVKAFFSKQAMPIPFSILETYKPMLAASMVMQTSSQCEHAISMEQLIMLEAKKEGKEIKGMETMAYQLSIFDSIPYEVQAKQLVSFITDDKIDEKAGKDYDEMAQAYRNQELSKLEALINKEEFGIGNFTDLLLYNRNANWVKTMQTIFDSRSVVVAVGAGHLPGDKGVINLLRKAGYTVEPIENKMIKNNQQQL